MATSCAIGVLGCILEQLLGKRGDAGTQTTQGGDGVTIPGGVQETCRYISEGHGLLSKVVLG